MVNTTRRQVLIGAASIGLAMPFISNAEASKFRFRCGSILPSKHAVPVLTREMAKQISAETNGDFELQIFADSQLGSDTDMMSQVRSGGIEMLVMSGTVMSVLIPASSINGVGYAFPDYDTVWKAMDGELGQHIISETNKAGLDVIGKAWDNGFRQITTADRPINSPADLKGLKLRVPPSPLWTALFKAFDVSPTSLSFGEVYSALQTKIVDGQENALSIVSIAKLNEVQQYCAMSRHMWDGLWFYGNPAAMKKIPSDIRAIIDKNFDIYCQREREENAALDARIRAELEAAGMKFTDPDHKPFVEQLRQRGFYAEWKKNYGDEAWNILEKYTGELS